MVTLDSVNQGTCQLSQGWQAKWVARTGAVHMHEIGLHLVDRGSQSTRYGQIEPGLKEVDTVRFETQATCRLEAVRVCLCNKRHLPTGI